jgi:hypothetical protein
MSVTPQQIEKRLYDLSLELDEAHSALVDAENIFHVTTAKYEINMAKTRLKYAQGDMKMTVNQREDQALMENAEDHMALAIAEAGVKANRANVARLRTQVDITRSISSSVKATLEL